MPISTIGRELGAPELKTLMGLSTKQLKDARDLGMEFRQRDSGAYVYNSATVFSFFTDRNETLETLEADVQRAKLRLTELQADKIVISNALSAKELAPISLLSEVLNVAISGVVFILEAIPTRVKSSMPEVDADVIRTIELEVAMAMEECSRVEFPDEVGGIEPGMDSDE